MASDHSSPQVLLVEGEDDRHVVWHLIQRAGLNLELPIRPEGGINLLLEAIEEEVMSPASGRKTVGIMLDANDDPAARWQAIRGRIHHGDIQLPDHPQPHGTIIAGTRRRPRIGIWLMPDNQNPGELEDFIRQMIPPDDPVWPRSEAYINDIPAEDRKFTKGKIVRAKVHAWLATREAPRPMGRAITTGDLDIAADSCQTFTGWLRDLFETVDAPAA